MFFEDVVIGVSSTSTTCPLRSNTASNNSACFQIRMQTLLIRSLRRAFFRLVEGRWRARGANRGGNASVLTRRDYAYSNNLFSFSIDIFALIDRISSHCSIAQREMLCQVKYKYSTLVDFPYPAFQKPCGPDP